MWCASWAEFDVWIPLPGINTVLALDTEMADRVSEHLWAEDLSECSACKGEAIC